MKNLILFSLLLIISQVSFSQYSADLWLRKDAYLYNNSSRGIVIGKGIINMPAGYSVYAADGILTEKVKVAIRNSEDWSDYVFAAGYRLNSLLEVEKFIKINKHLPGVPSANSVVKNGIDLGKMDAVLLKKIEELTLYMIEMQKEINRLKADKNLAVVTTTQNGNWNDGTTWGGTVPDSLDTAVIDKVVDITNLVKIKQINYQAGGSIRLSNLSFLKFCR